MTSNLTWEALLSEEQNQPYFQSMIEHIETQRKEGKASILQNKMCLMR